MSIYVQAILNKFQPLYKAIDWEMEYELDEDGTHRFWCHKIGVDKRVGNYRTVTVFTERTTKNFSVEYTEVLLREVFSNNCFIVYDPHGELEAMFFNKEQYENYTLNK